MKTNQSCNERIDKELDRTIEDIANALDGKFDEDYEDIYEWFNSYALSWDKDINTRYDSLCLSWGGPADYIRYYKDGRISYVFQDWFDGAERFLDGYDYKIAKQLYDEVLNI
jgi:hypothetical protein